MAWPRPAITAAVSTKMTARLTGCGSASMLRSPRYGWGPLSEDRITGNSSTKPTSSSKATGVQRR